MTILVVAAYAYMWCLSYVVISIFNHKFKSSQCERMCARKSEIVLHAAYGSTYVCIYTCVLRRAFVRALRCLGADRRCGCVLVFFFCAVYVGIRTTESQP